VTVLNLVVGSVVFIIYVLVFCVGMIFLRGNDE